MIDQLLMDNYLLILKNKIKVYIHGTLESSNKNIRELLKYGLEETIKHQANTYDKMTEYGWYTINNVKKNVIKETLNTIKNN